MQGTHPHPGLLLVNVEPHNLINADICYVNLDDGTRAGAIHSTVGRINAMAPIIGMSLALNGNIGTLRRIAELLQLDSPLTFES